MSRMDSYIDPLGSPIPPEGLHLAKARAFAFALRDSLIQFADLVECRTQGSCDVVVLRVEVELPQRRIHPIQPFERIAVYFDDSADSTPEVVVLRKDFPRTPHLNLRSDEYPRSLCLYDEPFRDVARRWTPQRFVESIRDWLALTAKGKLHQDDQPLEPLMFGQVGAIVLPADVVDASAEERPNRLTVTATSMENGKLFLIAERSERGLAKERLRMMASVHLCGTLEHGIIRRKPSSVKELADFVAPAGLDLLGELRTRLQEWKEESSKDPSVLESRVALVVVMPKARRSDLATESREVWAFLSADTVSEAGRKLGVWEVKDGAIGYILGCDAGKTGDDLRLDLLNPVLRLTRQSAASLNRSRLETPPIAAVGVGALGSQVVVNLARSGYGTWTLIDDDRLLPHNLARHALFGDFVGYPKGETVALAANSITDGEPAFTTVIADVVSPGDKATAVKTALDEAALILDMSASVSVARHLASKVESQSRRASLFLTPTGEDLVLLAEDRERSSPLDSLEMQYYRALVTDARLDGHFKPRDQRRRYGQSCRDVTSDLPQELVALHAAIGGRAVKDTVSDPSARITIWRASLDGNVRRIDVDAAEEIRHRIGEWTVSIDSNLIRELARIREAKLPRETGGVLLGAFDLEAKVLYLAHTIASPPDSQEWPTLYIRGCKGLPKKIEEVGRATDGMLEYVGEWHSHPNDTSTAPSDDDLQVFAWLTDLMKGEGLPAVMMIVGDGGAASCYLGQIAKAEGLLPKPKVASEKTKSLRPRGG